MSYTVSSDAPNLTHVFDSYWVTHIRNNNSIISNELQHAIQGCIMFMVVVAMLTFASVFESSNCSHKPQLINIDDQLMDCE